MDLETALDNANDAMVDFAAAWEEPAPGPMPTPIRRAMESFNRSMADV
ncbi:hypothetical protein [Nocardiopsis sp. NRRL B-16309]|nr:hypothetical protein [Nocardiopsis sp. NRRL B-16309]